MVWAIDRDMLSFPVSEALELFRRDAIGCRGIYTDPTDELLYIRGMENVNPIEFFTDYVLCYAKSRLISGLRDYGKYEKEIINYNHKQLVS